MELSSLAIEAAEELQIFSLKKNNDLKNAKELAKLIKVNQRMDYSAIFSQAYLSTYQIDLSKLNDKDSRQYLQTITEKLKSPSNLEDGELEKLINFCVNLSDYSAIHEEDIREMKGGSRW